MQESIFNQLSNAPIPERFYQIWIKSTQQACIIVQKAELYKTKLNETYTAENA